MRRRLLRVVGPRLKRIARRPLVRFAFFGLLLQFFWVDAAPRGVAPLAARAALSEQDEALLRRARSLGLQHGDPIIERRLVQKMRFVLEDSIRVDEAEVRRCALEAATTTPMLITFAQRFQARSSPGEQAHREAGGTEAGGTDQRATDAELRARYGAAFVTALLEAPADTWSGPVESPLGKHWVRRSETRPLAPVSQSAATCRRRLRDAAIDAEIQSWIAR